MSHSPLDKEKLRLLYKEEKRRLEEERKKFEARLDREREETEKLERDKSEKRIDAHVTEFLEQVRQACIGAKEAPKLEFWRGDEKECQEVGRRLRLLNCETLETRDHFDDARYCECRSAYIHAIPDPPPCRIVLTAVDFWSDPSPERNAQ